jgi:hypothetical protein
VFAGVVAGAFAFVIVILLLLTLANVSTVLLAIAFGSFDLAAIALAVRVIWLARRGRAPAAPFLIALTVTLAGLLNTCALLMLSMSKVNFH